MQIIKIVLFFFSLIIFTNNLLEAQEITCEDVIFDLEIDGNDGNEFTLSIIPNTTDVPVTYIYNLNGLLGIINDTITTVEPFSLTGFNDLQGTIDCYIDGNLCHTFDEYFTYEIYGDKIVNCFDFEIDTYILCSADSSTYDAYLIISDLEEDIDYNFIYYGTQDDFDNFENEYFSIFGNNNFDNLENYNSSIINKIFEGDTIVISDISASNPIIAKFGAIKNGEFEFCEFAEYPNNPCYDSICDTYELSQILELTVLPYSNDNWDLAIFNVFLSPNSIPYPGVSVYVSVNDSIVLEQLVGGGSAPYDWFNDVYSPFNNESELISESFPANDTLNIEIAIEFEDCTYTYSETQYFEYEAPLSCEDLEFFSFPDYGFSNNGYDNITLYIYPLLRVDGEFFDEPITYVYKNDTMYHEGNFLFEISDYNVINDPIYCYYNGELCATIDEFHYYDLFRGGGKCLPINFNTYAICNEDSSTYDAYIIFESSDLALDSLFIEYNLPGIESSGNYIFGSPENFRLYSGDTLIRENIKVGNPIYLSIAYNIYGFTKYCQFSEYPQNVCYEKICDIIEMPNCFSYQINNNNTAILHSCSIEQIGLSLPECSLYLYHNDSLISSFYHNPGPFAELFNYIPYSSMSFNIEDTMSLEFVIELEECTFSETQTYIPAAASCEDISSFSLEKSCYSSEVRFTIIPSDLTVPFSYTHPLIEDTINHTGRLDLYLDVFSFMGNIDIFIGDGLCTSLDATTSCSPAGEECYNNNYLDVEYEILPIECDADSSYYSAKIIFTNFNNGINVIEYDLVDSSWYGVFPERQIFEGDTLTLENLIVGNPIDMRFYYLVNDEFDIEDDYSACHIFEYPENPCYENLCDVIEINDFYAIETGVTALISFNINLPNENDGYQNDGYLYINDSLYYSSSYYTELSGITGYIDIPTFIPLEFTEDLEVSFIIELDDCTYTNTQYFEYEAPLSCEDFNAELTVECINEDSYEVYIAIAGFNPSIGYYVNGELNTTETLNYGPFNVGTGYDYEITLANNAECIQKYSVNAVNCTSLAIELLDFSGEKLSKGNEINWTTASEYNSQYFTLQYALDGVHFEDITKISTKGNTNIKTQYNFLHETIREGKHFYRLLETDNENKTFVVSDIVILERKQIAEINIYPIPANDFLFIELGTENQLDVQNIQVFDIHGKIVSSQKRTKQSLQTIDVSALMSGTYFIAIKNGESAHFVKFLKQ